MQENIYLPGDFILSQGGLGDHVVYVVSGQAVLIGAGNSWRKNVEENQVWIGDALFYESRWHERYILSIEPNKEQNGVMVFTDIKYSLPLLDKVNFPYHFLGFFS